MKNETQCVCCKKWFWAWGENRNVCRQCNPWPPLDYKVLKEIKNEN